MATTIFNTLHINSRGDLAARAGACVAAVRRVNQPMFGAAEALAMRCVH